MKTIILNTADNIRPAEALQAQIAAKGEDAELIDTTTMDIRHCMGCNHCFLKTPGVCAIKDDYKQILKKLAHSDSLWLVSGTHFGFLDYKGKRVMDRILPMLNMDLCFRDGEMRHTLRYGSLNVGVVYSGEGNQQLLDFWCYRSSANLGGHSLGAYSVNKIKEVRTCM